MVNRIQKILQHYALTATQFAQEIGIQRSALSHIMSGRNKPSLDFVLKLKKRFPEVDTDWLLFGKGKMIMEEDAGTAQLNLPLADSFRTEEEQQPVYATKNGTKKSSLPEDKEDDLPESIVFFYKNGSFKKYRPRKD